MDCKPRTTTATMRGRRKMGVLLSSADTHDDDLQWNRQALHFDHIVSNFECLHLNYPCVLQMINPGLNKMASICCLTYPKYLVFWKQRRGLHPLKICDMVVVGRVFAAAAAAAAWDSWFVEARFANNRASQSNCRHRWCPAHLPSSLSSFCLSRLNEYYVCFNCSLHTHTHTKLG